MVVEKLPVVILPSGRVPGRVGAPDLGSGGGDGTEMGSRKEVLF